EELKAKESEKGIKDAIRAGFAGLPPEKVPSPADLTKMLQQEPISLATWVPWRKRLHDWAARDREKTKPAFDAAVAFLRPAYVQNNRHDLKHPLDNDPVAYLVLGLATYD